MIHEEIDKALVAIGASAKPLPSQDAMTATLQKAHDQIQALTLKGDISDEPEASLVMSAMAATPKPRRMMEILGTGQYELGDARWLQTLYNRLLTERVPFPRHDQLGITPIVKMENRVMPIRIAIAGDWGTGNASSQAIAAQIRALAPDHTIHLGDTYYSGEPEEMQANFIGHWPYGISSSAPSFALNGNHEMYSGGEGFFHEVLSDPQFQAQQGLSYFALENDAWVILGLDTAYFAQDTMYKAGFLDPVQLAWADAMETAARAANKKVILLTHHNGLDISGSVTTNALWEQVLSAVPAHYWYWGHNHAGVAFSSYEGTTARCVGHGGIPYEPLAPVAGVEWTETELAGDPEEPRRALNGFMLLTFDGPNLTEEFYDEKGTVRWKA
jgi:hypothetical protein